MAVRYVTIKSDGYITGVSRVTSSAQVTNTRVSLPSNAFIDYPQESIICDGEAVDEIIDEFGVQVILRVVTKTFEDEYGDAEEFFVDHRIKAMVTVYTASDDEVKEGVFKSGEVLLTFQKEYESIVVPGNRVLYAGTWYEIRSITKQPTLDVLYYLQARVQKI